MNDSWNAYKEKATHGSILLPMRRYRCRVPQAYRELSLHWHEEVEVTQIMEGAIDYNINFTACPVKRGDLLFITPHTLHAAHEILGQEMVSETLVFHLELLGLQTPDSCTIKYIAPLHSGKAFIQPVVSPGQPGYEALSACFMITVGLYQEKPVGYELQIKQQMYQMMALLYQWGYVTKTNKGASGSEVEDKLKAVLAYIQKNYQSSMSIKELAGVCHFSQVHFMNFFKKMVGMTCVEYMNQYRLEMAASALLLTGHPVMEVALESGFGNISYFNRLFKERYQMTPKEYRKITSPAVVDETVQASLNTARFQRLGL